MRILFLFLAFKMVPFPVPKVKGAADVTIVGLMVSLDRMEVGKGGVKCALDEVKDLYGFETAAIVSMAEVVECLYNKECNGEIVIDASEKTSFICTVIFLFFTVRAITYFLSI